MSTRSATARRRPARAAARPAAHRRAQVRRRRIVAILTAAGLAVVAMLALQPVFHSAVKEIALPLRHEDIIRQQAHDKRLDPALVAAVIYTESRFRDQTSHAGARGLMQITPETANAIAKHSGGIRFEQSDLSDPQINISYGAYYLRLLLDHYEQNDALAVAAYNAGIGNVDRWVAAAGGVSEFRTAEHIPFPETRAYVENVMQRRQDYRDTYRDELGL